MKWINPRERLPFNRQQVLIRYKGICNLAVFDRAEQKFRLINGSAYCINDKVKWIELLN